MSDPENKPETTDLTEKHDALEARFADLESKYQAALDDEEADDPGKDAKALQKRVSDITSKRREMIADMRGLREELGGLKQQQTQAQSGYESKLAEALAAKDTEFATRLEGFDNTRREDLALSDAGIKDDLGRTAVRQAYQALPEDKRGDGTAADWWATTLDAQKAHLADPENVSAPSIPRTLLGYIPGEVGPTTVSHPNTEKGRAKGPQGNVTAADIAGAKTMEEYNALKRRMMEQQRKGR